MTSNVFVVKVDLLLYATLLNIIMFAYLYTQQQKKTFSLKLLLWAIGSITLITIAEIATWCTSEFGICRCIPIRYIGNVICVGLAALPGCIGLTYLDFKIFGDEKRTKKRSRVYLLPVYFGIAIMIYNVFEPGAVFYIDEANHYHRGTLLYISALLMYGFMFIVALWFFLNKRLMTARIMKATGLYFIVPIIGLCLQLAFYGTTFTMPSHTMAIFIIFLLLEREALSKDSLTNLYTRPNFESWLNRKIKASEAFSMILVDVNDFKMINDTYGHLEGDKVLQIIAEILIHSTNIEDLVCRYGGDEFFLLIENDEDIGGVIINRIKEALNTHNENKAQYKIKLSFGNLYVSKDNKQTMNDLINQVDRKMYEDKIHQKSLLRQEERPSI